MADPVREVLDLPNGVSGCRHFLDSRLLSKLSSHLSHVPRLGVSRHDPIRRRHDLRSDALDQFGLVGEQLLELDVRRFLVNVGVPSNRRACIQDSPNGRVLLEGGVSPHEDDELNTFLELRSGPGRTLAD